MYPNNQLTIYIPQSFSDPHAYGIRAGEEAGTYTVPLPPEAISGNHVSLRLILQQGRVKRTPTEKQIKNVHLQITSGR